MRIMMKNKKNMALSRKCALQMVCDMSDADRLLFFKDVFRNTSNYDDLMNYMSTNFEKCIFCQQCVNIEKKDSYKKGTYKQLDRIIKEIYICIECKNNRMNMWHYIYNKCT